MSEMFIYVIFMPRFVEIYRKRHQITRHTGFEARAYMRQKRFKKEEITHP